jgi:NAD(P)-dependent dehydrogenase (short-subunit alcohol dehydrogenase family)
MTESSLRVAVVGASSGLGRCLGVGLARRGAQVALLARRKDRLDDAVTEAGQGAVAVRCDVTDQQSCQDAVEEAARALGGIDALVYAPGIGTLARLADLDLDTWRRTFDTNVIGAALITAAALPHLQATSGTAAYLSSISASMTPPWPGLGSYAVSKAALDKLVEAWRAEHPQVGFTRVVVGDCAGGEGAGLTEFAAGWDLALMGEVHPIWAARGYLSGSLLDVDELVRVVDHVLRADATIPSVTVTPRPPG